MSLVAVSQCGSLRPPSTCRDLEKLTKLFPKARVIESVFDMLPADKITLLIAPVKGQARIRVKVEEYAEQHGRDINKWPVSLCRRA